MDPLTAVVIVAIFGAGAAVSILQMDQDSNQAVELVLDQFQSGDLPAVCCKTGEPADVGVTVVQRRFFRTVVEGVIPITRARHLEFQGWKDVNRWSSLAIAPVFLIGSVLDALADSVIVSWAVDLPLLALVLTALYSNLKAQRLLASPRLDRRSSDDGTVAGIVTLRGVHPAFVAAVRSTRQSADDAPG